MALIGWENAVDAAGTALAASSAAEGFPVAMLREPSGNPANAWQTAAGVTTADVTITAPAAVAWRMVALCRTNLTPAATLRVRIGTAANVVSSPAYDGGTVSAGVAFGMRQALHILPSAVSAVCMRLDIADPTNPDGYLNIPLAFAGPAAEFNVSVQSDDGDEIRRADVQTRGGGVIVDPLSRARDWQVRLDFIREAQAAWIDPLKATAAQGISVLFVPFPSGALAGSQAVFGQLTPARRGFPGQMSTQRNWAFQIKERL